MKPYYSDSGIELYHGDCREIGAWLDADILVTDPPYGIAWPAGQLHSERSIREQAEPCIIGDNDTSSRDRILEMWGDRPAVIFGSWRAVRPHHVRHRLIWHKLGRHPGVSPAPVFPNDEEIYLIGDGWLGAPMPTVITTTEQRAMQPGLIGHPTPKPIYLMERLISKCPNGTIADPFAGSGATLLAAKLAGRRAIGIEINQEYCDIAADSLRQGVLFGNGAA